MVKNTLQAEGKDIHNSQFYTHNEADWVEKPFCPELCVKPVPLRGTETKTASCALWLEKAQAGDNQLESRESPGGPGDTKLTMS